jgi:chorismate mutase
VPKVIASKVRREPKESLASLRAQVDALDAVWLQALRSRFEVTQRIHRLKRQDALPMRDPEREARLLERVRRLSEDPALVALLEDVYRRVLRNSLRHK